MVCEINEATENIRVPIAAPVNFTVPSRTSIVVPVESKPERKGY
jgi:hypothetical protein